MFSESKGGREEEKKTRGKKRLLQVEVHGSADHPFTQGCSEGVLRGAEASAVVSPLYTRFVRAGRFWGACFQGISDGGVGKLTTALRALAKSSHSAHQDVPFPVNLWHRDPPVSHLPRAALAQRASSMETSQPAGKDQGALL